MEILENVNCTIETENGIEIKGLFDIAKNPDLVKWEPYSEGVSVYPIYKDKNGASAALFKLEAGAQTPQHLHESYEHALVLSGKNVKIWENKQISVQNEGDLFIAKPGTKHSVSFQEDGIVLLISEKPKNYNCS